MESHEELIEELDEIIKELKEDPHNSSAAFRLFEISEFLVRGFLNDFELEHHAEDHQDPLHDEEHDEQPELESTPEPAPEEHAAPEPKTLPFAVVNHATAPALPSFTNMKRNVNEWLEPAVEFETKDEAIEFVKENVEAGSVIEVDWESGHGEIVFAIEP